MRVDLHGEHEVARGRAAAAGVPAAGEAHEGAVADARRDLDVQPLASDRPPLPGAARAGAALKAPAAVAVRAAPGEDHVPAASPDLPGAAAARAGHGTVGHLARPSAALAGLEPHELHPAVRALQGLLEAEAGRLLEVLALHGLGRGRRRPRGRRRCRGSPPTPRAAAAEKSKPSKPPWGAGAAAVGPRLASIVGPPALGIGEDLEGAGHLAEPFGGHGVAGVQVGVEGAGALLERATDLRRARAAPHSEELVQVHGPTSCRRPPRRSRPRRPSCPRRERRPRPPGLPRAEPGSSGRASPRACARPS